MRENGNGWNRSEEREISLLELFWKILYSWRFIVICAVIFAVILGGYSYVKSRQSVQNIKNQANLSEEDMEESLSPEEKEAVRQAKSVQQRIEEKEKYLEESILMNLDAYHQNRKMLQYYVDTNYTWSLNSENEEDYAKELIDAYATYVDTQGILEDLKKEVKWEEEDAYIGELIAVYDIQEEKSSQNTFSVYVTGKDEEMVQALSDAVETAIAEYRSLLSEKIGSHELVLVDSHEGEFVNEELAVQQENLNSSISDLKTQRDTLTSEFSEAQEKVLYGIQKENDGQSQDVQLKAGFSKKYILLGFVAGIFLSALWVVLSYVLSKKIKSAEEIQELYGMRMFGAVSVECGNKKPFLSSVDKWLEKKQRKEKWTLEEERELILTNLSVTCKKEKILKVFFTSSLHLDEENKKNIYYFVEKLEEIGIQAAFGENILRNAKAFEQMSEIENVIFIEKAGETRYETLEKQLTLCDEQGARILGMLMLE